MIEQINWYPGHMKKTRELIQENMKAVDCVVELVDARIPSASRNPVIRELTGDKPKVVLLSKPDLADAEASIGWLQRFQKEGATALTLNCMTGQGTKPLMKILSSICDRRRGNRAERPFRLMVVGIPNVGKSSLINRLTGRKSTRTGDRPGVTRGKQWLTLSNGMQMLDTPGILWPKFEDPQVGLDLAFCGAIKDEILDSADLALELIRYLCTAYPSLLMARYHLDRLEEEPLETMHQIAQNRGFLLPGKRIDYERCGRAVLDDFRSGKIGRITLERP